MEATTDTGAIFGEQKKSIPAPSKRLEMAGRILNVIAVVMVLACLAMVLHTAIEQSYSSWVSKMFISVKPWSRTGTIAAQSSDSNIAVIASDESKSITNTMPLGLPLITLSTFRRLTSLPPV